MNDVRKSVEDMAYTAVGVGVLGTQAVVAKGRHAKGLVEDVRERVEPVIAKISERVEPVFEQLGTKAGEIVEVGTAKARTFLGRAPAPAAASPEQAGNTKSTSKVA